MHARTLTDHVQYRLGDQTWRVLDERLSLDIPSRAHHVWLMTPARARVVAQKLARRVAEGSVCDASGRPLPAGGRVAVAPARVLDEVVDHEPCLECGGVMEVGRFGADESGAMIWMRRCTACSFFERA